MTINENHFDQHSENAEKVRQISVEILEPALQSALAEARKDASAQEVVSALANCYAGLLVDLMGRKAAATFLEAHAVHVASVEEQSVNA